jgi:hypothetical protein
LGTRIALAIEQETTASNFGWVGFIVVVPARRFGRARASKRADFLTNMENSRVPTRQFKNLILINNWPGSLAGIMAGLVISFLLFGFWWPYWRIADMDLWMVYEAWLFNDGLSQEWFDHPGYLTILLLGNWFRLLHDFGLLDVHALSAVPAPANAEHAWTAAVRAGRVLSLFLAAAFVLGFGVLLRRLIGDWRVAVLATLALAFSGGVAMEARIIRTELIAGSLVTIALLILLNAARTPRSPWRPALAGLAALLATLGLVNKVQLIFLICALPIILMPFGCRSDDPTAFWRRSPLAIPISALVGAGAVLIAIPAASLVWLGLSQASAAFSHPFVLGTFGIYQMAIAAWIALAMIGFAIVWRVSASETLATMSAVLAGIAIGLLFLDVRYDPQNVIVVMNPLEKLVGYASNLQVPEGASLPSGLARSLLHGVYIVFATRTFVLDSSPRPAIFLEWLVIAAAIYAWKAGDRRLVAQVAVLMCVAWGMDAIYALRSLQLQYYTLTDPLVIIAAAWLLAKLPGLQAHERAYQIGALLIAAHFVLSQSEPVKHTFQSSKPYDFCVEHFAYIRRIERFPYCLPAA